MLAPRTLNGLLDLALVRSAAIPRSGRAAAHGDSALTAFLDKVAVKGDEFIGDTGAVVRIEQVDHPAVVVAHDLAERLPADALERGLRDKAAALLGRGSSDQLRSEVARLETVSARDLACNLRARA